VLIEEALTDEAFLARYCVGWPEMVAYLRGEEDGVVRRLTPLRSALPADRA
jgi:biotin/methionine sulfoxide reductase